MIMKTSQRSGKVERSGISGAFPDCLAAITPPQCPRELIASTL